MSVGSDLDAAIADIRAAIADIRARLAAVQPPVPVPDQVPDPAPVQTPDPLPVPEPTPPPVVPDPVPTPEPAPTPAVDLSVATTNGTVWSLAADGRVLANGVPWDNYGWGTVPQIKGTAFRLRGADVFLLMDNWTWAGWTGAVWQATSVDADGQPISVAPAPVAPSGGGGPVVVPSGPPVAVALFPLPDPLPVPPASTNTNPKLLRVADITPVIDPATGEPWYADLSLAPLTRDGQPVYDNLGYGASFKLRRVDGDLRVVYAVGGGYGAPTSAREFSLAGIQPGRVNLIEFTNNWPEFSGRDVFSPGDYVAIGIDPMNPQRIWSSGSMDYAAVQTATVFERTVGPNGSVADLAAASFGHIQRNDRDQITGIDGLNGKECTGGITRTPAWMQRAYNMQPLMLLGGQYTSLVAQAAAASMGLFAATFKDVDLRLPRAADAIVPVTICADHRNGSRREDWANPIDADGRQKETFAPGTQPFDRGRCIGGFIQNWLDTSVGIASASRTTLWKVDCDGTICTTTEGPPWAPLDQGAPNMDMFDWWKNGVEIWQHGVKRLVYPTSYVGIGHFEGETFVGEKIPVRFVGGLDATHIEIDTDLGTLKDAYFIGPNAVEFFRQFGFDDRNQWDGVFPDGFGRWPWGTGYMQTPTVIGDDEDGDRKRGGVCLYNGALGQVFYDHSTFQSDARVCEWHIHDLDDLGKGSIGQIQHQMVQPADMALDPILTDDCRRFGRTQGILSWGQWSSLDWDRETDELYVFGNLMAHAITGGQLRMRKYKVNRAVRA